MRQIINILIFKLIFISSFAQTSNDNVKILSKSEIKEIFTDKIKSDLGISYSIFRTYYFKDKSGEFYLVLTEKEYKRENDKPLNDSIKGFCVKKVADSYFLEWKMKDFILKENKANTEEYSIWFWTKYFYLRDFDNDGLIDPIIIYGTSGINGTEDGRIKFLIYYKGKKYAIRHQNGTLDYERNTQVDSVFYNLPISIQKHIRGLMEKMIENNHAIFSNGYKENMDTKKTYFDEN